jgi:predicted transcriptional regulator
MTLTLKMRALQAMQAHTKATATQIAADLQHNLQKTRAIISDLMQAGLARNVGMIDGYTAYEITADGAAALTRTEDAKVPPTAPAVTPQFDSAPASQSQLHVRQPQPRKRLDIEIPAFREQVRFGLLNSGELMILAPGLAPLLLSATTTDAMRELLSQRIV